MSNHSKELNIKGNMQNFQNTETSKKVYNEKTCKKCAQVQNKEIITCSMGIILLLLVYSCCYLFTKK